MPACWAAQDTALSAIRLDPRGAIAVDGVEHKPFWTGAPYAIQQLAADLRVFRFELRQGDDGGHDAWRSEKVELQGVRPLAPPGRELWHSWSLFIPEGSTPELDRSGRPNWLILGQWHATEDTIRTRGFDDDPVSPPLAYDYAGGVMRITVRTDADPKQRSSRNPVGRDVYRDDHYPRGRWVGFVEHLRFGWRHDALLQVWRDGHLIVDRVSDFDMGYNDVQGPHIAWGVYRNRFDPHPFVVFYGDQHVSVGAPSPAIKAALQPGDRPRPPERGRLPPSHGRTSASEPYR